MVVVSAKRGSILPQRQGFLHQNARCTIKAMTRSRFCFVLASALTIFVMLYHICFLSYGDNGVLSVFPEALQRLGKGNVAVAEKDSQIISHETLPSFSCPIGYGSRGGGAETATYIRDAILEGFRCIVTSSHHQKHNETGVGEGWKAAVAHDPSISRSDLFLQTMFVPFNGNDFNASPDDPSNMKSLHITEQVDLTIKQSLQNLQTSYIDAVLFNNFRARLHPFDEMLQAWQTLEKYVDQGVIRFLGITSVHDAGYLEKLHEKSRIKPVILQNRFHKNRGFDVALKSTIERLGLHVQRFWILTGNGGGHANRAMASEKSLSKEQLILAFVMSLGNTMALVGTHNHQHMRDDLSLIPRFHVDNDIFLDMYGMDQDRKTYAEKLGMTGYTTPKHFKAQLTNSAIATES